MNLSEIDDAAEFASAAEHAIGIISDFIRAGGMVTLEGEGDYEENTRGCFAMAVSTGSKHTAGCTELLDTLGELADELRTGSEEGDTKGDER